MTRASKVCPHCPNLAPCPVPGHAKQPWAGSTRRQQLPKGWSNRIVPRILARDHICTICRTARSTEVHHTADPGDHREVVLAGVCHDCHAKATAKQAARARRGA